MALASFPNTNASSCVLPFGKASADEAEHGVSTSSVGRGGDDGGHAYWKKDGQCLLCAFFGTMKDALSFVSNLFLVLGLFFIMWLWWFM